MNTSTRGSRSAQFGDLTGARHQIRVQEKADQEEIIQSTVSAIRSQDDIAIVVIPGGRSWAVPREVIRFLGAK